MNNTLLKHKKNDKHQLKNNKGFSLVEVTIATGIAAFGIITLLGLLPSGMKMFRDAMNVTVSSQIAQRLIKEAVQTDYDVLVGENPSAETPIIKPMRYFNDEGVELTGADTRDAVFQVHTRIMAATTLPAVAVINNNSLATITVQVALNPSNQSLPIKSSGGGDPQAGLIDPTTAVPFVTYNSHIAKIK